jgi:hypothetical protein
VAPKVWTQTAELAQVGVAGTDGGRTLEELNTPMSFMITIVTREGIVMAADSRLTLSFPDPNFKDPANPDSKLLIAVPQSDATQKLFLAGERVGISTCGFASIQNTPISGFIESFILTLSEDISLADTAEVLLQYFQKIDPKLSTLFHVAGYTFKNGEPPSSELWMVSIAENQKVLTLKGGEQGARWNGELDIINRIFLQVSIHEILPDPSSGAPKPTGNYLPVPHYGVDFNHLTLQDAVDLAVFAVRTTIETMRFQARLRSVGGPIDVLVIKSTGANWLQRKELKVR